MKTVKLTYTYREKKKVTDQGGNITHESKLIKSFKYAFPSLLPSLTIRGTLEVPS